MGKGRRPTWRLTLALAGLLAVADREPGLAATGVCDANPPTSMDACLTEAGFALCAVWGADVLFLDGFQECSL